MTTLILEISIAVYLLITVLIAARFHEGYSHIFHTVGVLGQRGAENHKIVTYGIFLVVGLSMLLIAYLHKPFSSPQSVLALCYSIGYLTGVILPSDEGSPIVGSEQQFARNLGGTVLMVGGSVSLIRLGETLGLQYTIGGITVALLSVAITFDSPLRGLMQRSYEAILLTALIFAPNI